MPPKRGLPPDLHQLVRQNGCDLCPGSASYEAELERLLGEIERILKMRDDDVLESADPEGLKKKRVIRLAQDLKRPDSADRKVAARELEKMGADARDAIPSLIEALTDQDAIVRQQVAAAIYQIGPSQEHTTALIHGLSDSDLAVRERIAETFPRIDGDKVDVVQELTAALTDTDPVRRAWTAKALYRIGSDAKSAAAALCDLLSDSDAEVRENAALALGETGGDPSQVIPLLISTLGDEHPKVRQVGAHSLGRFGQAATAALPRLVATIRDDPDQDVRTKAVQAIGYIGHPTTECVAALIEVLNEPVSSFICFASAFSLGQLGKGAILALPSLRRLLDGKLREVAQWAIDQIAGGTSGGVTPE